MNSFLSIVMIISILMGNITIAPVSLMQMKSGEIQFTIETKLNKPLDKKLAEEIGDSIPDHMTTKFDIKYKMSEDFKKMELQCDMLASNGKDEPLGISYWVNQDLSDKNVPKSLFIMKPKDMDKYQVINIQAPVVQKTGMTFSLLFGGIFSAEKMNTFGKSFAESFKESGTKLTENNGVYSAVLNDAAVKKLLKEIVLAMSNYLAPMFGVNTMAYTTSTEVSSNAVEEVPKDNEQPSKVKETVSQNIKSQMDTAINEFFEKLNNVKLFKKDALVLHMTLNDKKQPKSVRYDFNIETNAYDLTKAFGGSWNENLQKENANIDLTVSLDYVYNNVNEDIKIEYPTLTAENSEDIVPGITLPDIDINTVNIVCEGNLKKLSHQPFIKDGVVYLPLREVLNLQGIDNESILWDNGVVKIETPNITAELKIGSNELTRNDQSFKTSTAVVLQNETTYIPASLLGELSIGSVTNTFYDNENAVIGCVVSINKYPPISVQRNQFAITSDVDPMWEKYLVQAGDKAGVNIDVNIIPVENYKEKTNLIIAAGESIVMIGKYDEAFLKKLEEMEATYPPIRINEAYHVIIPRTVRNLGMITEVIKNFVSLVNQK